jgi:hypothetical protein
MNAPGLRSPNYPPCTLRYYAPPARCSSGFPCATVSLCVSRPSRTRWTHLALSPINVPSSSPPSITTPCNPLDTGTGGIGPLAGKYSRHRGAGGGVHVCAMRWPHPGQQNGGGSDAGAALSDPQSTVDRLLNPNQGCDLEFCRHVDRFWVGLWHVDHHVDHVDHVDQRSY